MTAKVLEIRIDAPVTGQTEVDALLFSIDQLREAQKQLRAEGKHTSEQYKQNEAQLKNLRSEHTREINSIRAVKGSYDELNATHKRLLAEQKRQNLETAEGRKEFERLGREAGKLDVRLKALDAQMGSHTRNVGNYNGAVEKFRGTLMNLAGAFGIAFSLSTVIAWGAAAFRAFGEAERAHSKLLKGLNGQFDVQERLIDQADKLQKTTIYEDETIVNAQAFLAAQGRTEAQIRKTIEAAVELAAVTDGDLNKAVKQLDATFEGNIGKLSKLDSEFKNLTLEQLENGGAIDLIREKWKGYAEVEGKTALGQLEREKHAIDEVGESAGSVVNKLKQYALAFLQYGTRGAEIVVAQGRQVEEQRKRSEDLVNTRYNEVVKLAAAGDVLAKQELDRRKALYGQVKQETDSIASLEDRITKKKDALKEAEIGSANYVAINNELIDLENRLAEVTGKNSKDLAEHARQMQQLSYELQQFAIDNELTGAERKLAQLHLNHQKELDALRSKFSKEIQATEQFRQRIKQIEEKYAEDKGHIEDNIGKMEYQAIPRQVDIVQKTKQEKAKGLKSQEGFNAAIEEDNIRQLTGELMVLDAKANAYSDFYQGISSLIARDEKERKKYGAVLKALAIAEILINLQREIAAINLAARINAQNMLTGGIYGEITSKIQTVAAYARAGFGVANVLLAKFEKGGILQGPSHAYGGIQLFGSGGYYGEAEGGEPILTKNVSRNPALLAAASHINVLAGGMPLVPSPHMAYGGITSSNFQMDYNQIKQAFMEAIAASPAPIMQLDDTNTSKINNALMRNHEFEQRKFS